MLFYEPIVKLTLFQKLNKKLMLFDQTYRQIDVISKT